MEMNIEMTLQWKSTQADSSSVSRDRLPIDAMTASDQLEATRNI